MSQIDRTPDIGRSSVEYHKAHLAFARAEIVAAAANREPLIDRLRSYTADVRKAEQDRIGAEVERLREATDALLVAYDRSGLTDLRWFVPYVEALRDARG